MNKKDKCIAVSGFILSAFLLLCAVINLFSGHIGAAICSLGTAVFFFAISFAAYNKAMEKNGITVSDMSDEAKYRQ